MSRNFSVILVLSSLVVASACDRQTPSAPAPAPDSSLSAAELTSIASEAYIFGVPMVDTYKTVYAFNVDTTNPQYKGPFNSILNIARVFTPDDTAFVTPNSDTPYSFAMLDLRAEPVVITVPEIEKNRYFVLQLMDLYTFNFAYIGSRATGNEGGSYLIAGPAWQGEVPVGIAQVIRSETSLVSVVGRTQLFNPADLDNVKRIQASYNVQPLSAFLGTTPPPAAPPIKWIKPLSAGEDRKSLSFFNELAFLLQFAQPPHPTEVELRERFANIGIEPGKPFNFAAMSPEQQAALKDGMVEGQKKIDERRASLGGRTDMLFGSRDFLRNDYVARATGTQVGIGANSREEALYPMYEKDSTGQPLDGSHKYVLRFARGQLPPVNAFWSLTMYNLPEQLLVRNPINRYLINSSMLPTLKKNADGGVTLYIQADSPGKARESNWLPAPPGPFMLAMRYYWPKQELLDDQWKSPPVERVQ
jgi:hypothetical protein